MTKNLGSNLLLALALSALLYAVIANPPGGVRWGMFAEEPSPVVTKIFYVVSSYLWPSILSFAAITMFQLQFRLTSSGATKRTVFSMCVLASGSMLLALRAISFSPNAGPSYVAGMAAGYTVMSRLYAVRMREVLRRVRVPWPIWRGDRAAVEEFDRVVRERRDKQRPAGTTC